jgi:predicted aspartyl protease
VGVVEVMGMEAYVHLLVSSDVEVVLIGAAALEILVLKVDPVTGKLIKGKVYLLRG